MSNLCGYSPLTWRSPSPYQLRSFTPVLSIILRPQFLSPNQTPPPHVVTLARRFRRRVAFSPPVTVSSLFTDSSVSTDLCATAAAGAIAQCVLRLCEETAKRGIFDQKLTRKLTHTSIGLVFMLCWPLFSSGHRGAIFAALIPAINIIKMLLIGLEIWKDEGTVKSMCRYGDPRELLKGPLYYASTIGLAAAVYWRTSPISIAIICNLCAGDGIADIIGRRFGTHKLPYNRCKSFEGSVSMAVAGFVASIGFMHYFSSFGYFERSWKMVVGFLIISIASALVESHPLSTEIDDNLTVPLTGVLIGSLVQKLVSFLLDKMELDLMYTSSPKQQQKDDET